MFPKYLLKLAWMKISRNLIHHHFTHWFLWVRRQFEGKDVSNTVLIPPGHLGLICLTSSIPTLDVSAFDFQIPRASSDFSFHFEFVSSSIFGDYLKHYKKLLSSVLSSSDALALK